MRRQRKICNWLNEKDTQMTLAVWCSLAEPLMSLHYDLFAHGSVSKKKAQKREAAEASTSEGTQAQTNQMQPEVEKGR